MRIKIFFMLVYFYKNSKIIHNKYEYFINLNDNSLTKK
jgi:hypothetical protein